MTQALKKVWVASKHTNRISYRALDKFEQRNPSMFNLSHSAHNSWEEAHAWLLAETKRACESATKDAKRTRARFERAKVMTRPAEVSA